MMDERNLPRRRRDDDLTINEYRLLALEKKAEQCIGREEFERLRNSVHELSIRIDSLKTWIVGTAIAVCSILITATGLFQTFKK